MDGAAAKVHRYTAVPNENGRLHDANGNLTAIEVIEPGGTVLAWNAESGAVGEYRVLRTFVTPDQEVYAAAIETESTTEELQVTQEHPFWVMGRGWVRAHALEPGMRLRTATSDVAEVVYLTKLPGRVTVYNFEVETAHTYFVGQANLRVHNNPCAQGAGGARSLDDLVNAAQSKYPGKAGTIEKHHITPKYLGGDSKGPRVPLDAAYHQEITNEFRRLAPYGEDYSGLQPADVQKLKDKVYGKYPLPDGQ